jgi:hypothetical protein
MLPQKLLASAGILHHNPYPGISLNQLAHSMLLSILSFSGVLCGMAVHVHPNPCSEHFSLRFASGLTL